MTKIWKSIGILAFKILKAFPEGEIVIRRKADNKVQVFFRMNGTTVALRSVDPDRAIDYIFDSIIGGPSDPN